QPRAVPEVVSPFVRDEFQDADAGRSQPTRLPARRVAGIRFIHNTAAPRCAVEDALFPRRRPLGPEAPEFPALVQDSERLGGPVGGETGGRWSVIIDQHRPCGSDILVRQGSGPALKGCGFQPHRTLATEGLRGAEAPLYTVAQAFAH